MTAPTQGLMPPHPWREWTAESFTVQADERVASGIDGEAVGLEAPLSFRIRPQALRVRIARSHPGGAKMCSLVDCPGPGALADCCKDPEFAAVAGNWKKPDATWRSRC